MSRKFKVRLNICPRPPWNVRQTWREGDEILGQSVFVFSSPRVSDVIPEGNVDGSEITLTQISSEENFDL